MQAKLESERILGNISKNIMNETCRRAEGSSMYVCRSGGAYAGHVTLGGGGGGGAGAKKGVHWRGGDMRSL